MAASHQPIDLPKWIDVGVLPLVNLAMALLVAGLVVAGIGLDTVPVPGDTPPAKLAALDGVKGAVRILLSGPGRD